MGQSLLKRLNLSIPIVQAPMAGSTTPALTIAVSNAGALGSHGCAALSVQQARKDIRAIAAHTKAAFNVNFFCHQPPLTDATRDATWIELLTPYFREFDTEPPGELKLGYVGLDENPEMISMLLEEKPPVLSFHFGVPKAATISKFKAAGIVLFGCATNVSEALAIEAAKLDAIIVQGWEAGGHRGLFDNNTDTEEPLFTLLKKVKEQTTLPLIAAGGIMTGQDIAKALALGADLVQMGTAFLLCPDTKTTAAHRAALKTAKNTDTTIISVISGRPARGLSNRLHAELAHQAHLMPEYPYPYSASKALTAAALRRNVEEFSVHWAGAGVEKIRELETEELLRHLMEELNEASAH
ncbi:MAG TPA: nitronate monooxygenase [Alcanivoracaceae bacterium]|nr:nitronate monooxygenase [Alcanivoracaceae bacterium]